MRSLFLLFSLLLLNIPATFAMHPSRFPLLPTITPTSISILTPSAGQVVQGNFEIRGTTNADGFQSAELDFAYSQDNTNTWFLIKNIASPAHNDVLAVWDTTTITDGDYSLRLLVTMTDGNQETVYVPGLRVRNYSPVETDTPSPIPLDITTKAATPASSPLAVFTATMVQASLPPTSTSLPVNPAELSSGQIMLTVGRGALITFIVFIGLGGYLGFRYYLRHR